MNKRGRVTGISPTSDDRYATWCKCCSRGSWRQLPRDERAGPVFDTEHEAEDQLARHRANQHHKQALLAWSDTTESAEERMLREIFGEPPLKECARCNEHHHKRMKCSTASRLRIEGLREMRC